MQQCPHRQSSERQVKSGFNRTGTQRLGCQSCRRRHTPEPSPPGYGDKVREAWERTPEVRQRVIDSAPHASRCYSDAFNTYRELCWWGEHHSMYDKSETYSVEGDNA